MNELHKFKKRRDDKVFDLQKAERRIKDLVDQIRDRLDPFADISHLRADMVAELALQLADLQIRWRALRDEIAAIEKAMGI